VSRARLIALRLYADYLQAERLDEFEALLRAALERGYTPMTLSGFAEAPARDDRILLMRHDIDTDVARARRMWHIERRLGVVGSYFFRRSTWDVGFMRELAAGGNEVGYHYEELADVVKERGAGRATQARALIGDARERLRARLTELRATTGLDLDVLASHGDFANRAVGVSNVELLADAAFRARIGARLEAYDVEPHVSARSSDGIPPTPWVPEDPMHAIRRGERVVEVLVHPRSWGAAPIVNARADLARLWQGCAYGMRRATAATSSSYQRWSRRLRR
jgi:hypothetical protein